MALKIVLWVLGAIALILLLVFVGGAWQWQRQTQALREPLEAAVPLLSSNTVSLGIYEASDLTDLPLPVQRYFRNVLTDGQPLIAKAEIWQQGQLRMGETEASDRPFTAQQLVVPALPGFDWDARVAMAPGVLAYVHDAYVDGKATLHAALFGLFTVAHQEGSEELAQGELLRYLAEAVWFPTALLPSQRVRWEPIDDRSAQAILVDGDRQVSLTFCFDEEGYVSEVFTPGRYRWVDGEQQLTPWRGHFSHYEPQYGMTIPRAGWVEWELPTGSLTYWRGQITQTAYEWVK